MIKAASWEKYILTIASLGVSRYAMTTTVSKIKRKSNKTMNL